MCGKTTKTETSKLGEPSRLASPDSIFNSCEMVRATLLSGLLLTGVYTGSASAVTDEEMLSMMQQFDQCVATECQSEVLACQSDQGCLEALPCVRQCMVMDAPPSDTSATPKGRTKLPKNKVQARLRRLADEIGKDAVIAVEDIEKAAIDYESIQGFPGAIGGSF
eukprot:CAMPEP_0197864518 /NCGR_PEP_ID=MMETSP1438-20131217/42826_1 /TAXON_ID=1461541 /ORGANISM="Pterosperma sp., Strain CCMP1384" /LENGTH=164 /DNA_ID=CAMNT_0043482795 /DNA_START=339 /DNA_END=833 /DNA_ORIENTATION=-